MMWGWMSWWHWLSMAGVWIIGITVIVWAVTVLFPGPARRDPQRILDERFARGELDAEEYRARREELHIRARQSDGPRA